MGVSRVATDTAGEKEHDKGLWRLVSWGRSLPISSERVESRCWIVGATDSMVRRPDPTLSALAVSIKSEGRPLATHKV